MGMTGDLQVLVGSAPGRLRTLHAALTTWTHRARLAGAHRRLAELADVDSAEMATVHDLVSDGGVGDLVPAAGTEGDRGDGLGGSPASAARELGTDDVDTLSTSYAVVALPDRWRVVGRGYLAVNDGYRSWAGTTTLVTERDSSRAAISDAGAIGACLTPNGLLGGLALSAPEPADIEGRPCWVVEASLTRPAPNTGGRPLRLLRYLVGVDHRVWLDADTGIILRHEGSVDGELCVTTALTDLVFDLPVDDDEFRPPPGAVVRSRHELLRDHLSEMGVDPDTVDLDDPAQVRAALRRRAE